MKPKQHCYARQRLSLAGKLSKFTSQSQKVHAQIEKVRLFQNNGTNLMQLAEWR